MKQNQLRAYTRCKLWGRYPEASSPWKGGKAKSAWRVTRLGGGAGVPGGQTEDAVHLRPQYVGGGLPVAENSQVGTAVEERLGSGGHLVPSHFGMHMQPPKENLAGISPFAHPCGGGA